MIIEKNISLDLTINSGQTSQNPWIFKDNKFRDLVLIDNKPVIFEVKQNGNYMDFNFKGDVSENKAILKLNHIFDLDFDLDKFYKYLSQRDELKDMTKFCNGLRLFQAKDPLECVISSICSANNSIKRWTKSIYDIKTKWGENFNGFYTFPASLKDVYLDDSDELNLSGKCEGNNLKACGVGYRGAYMKNACEMFEDKIDLSEISSMKYVEAFDCILKVPGVGPKVADCILLYGFNFKEAFPSDVWIKRIVSYLYFDGKDISTDKVRDFGMSEFGNYAGYVQLYLFHYARKSGLMNHLK